MKGMICSAAAVALVMGAIFSQPVNANEQLIANICQYVQADNKSRLRKKLKESRVKVRAIYSGVKCNGESMVRSAMTNNADGVGVFLVKKLSVTQLQEKEGDGMSLLEWASANGHGASATAGEIQKRIGG
ncbi:DUF3718 domain-containing protein [Ferrimonas aestuarii]|uniref:DUF3718 domain-containing protein n=1 Tax=Ferrimonas aestuarii TaxID=2569539 RepID=A0A4U1BHP5_9GAMM|nr:DUF3718 domain-containing protein [Ferrimonas aestuarii]TKB50924.1 DUF3718 domain-containing protein [Ferrimonas aestuarii]